MAFIQQTSRFRLTILVSLFFLFASNFCNPFQSIAQTKKPKIGLVLSGGGAKGIAHVRVLQVLDSLGIVPDYIAGTSMGSVVGALYASGYSGHQIDSITRVIEWSKMFSNSLSFDEINIEEKDEFGRYIYELPLKGLTPQFPLGVVEGQQIEELLASLFFPVNTIADFNKLPTPFLCVAADIVKGEPVILRKGSLAAAVRASMSIPTVFSPVRIDGRLLVDGGVYMNLPVTYCRDMGADYIIAVDVGGGLYKEEELTSAASLLVQTTFLSGNISYQQEKEKSDIFVDVVKYLQYSTMDFEQGPSMMSSGDKAVKDVMSQLVTLSDNMKAYPLRKVPRVKMVQDKYRLQTIDMAGVSEENKDFVLEKFGWRSGDLVSREQITSSVHKLLGTRLFDKINYTIEGDSVTSVLTLRANEKPANAVKFGIHYDTDRGAGLILNFTKRNLFLPSSRFLTTLDLAETPRARVNYFYYIGNKSHWWHQTELYGENVELNTFVDGTPIPDVISRHFSAATNLNYSLDQNRYWGFGAFWQTNQLKPKIDPRTEANPDEFEIIKYNLKTMGARVHYQINTSDKVYFPTKGTWFRAEALANFGNPADAQLYINTPDTVYDYRIKGNVQNYLRINVRAQKNIEMSKKMTLQLRGQFGFTQEMSSIDSRFSAYRLAAGDFITVGGQIHRPRANSFTFTGLKEAELSVPQVMIAGANLQMTLSKNIYVIPSVNLLAAGYDSSEFWQSLDEFNFSSEVEDKAFYQFGYGVTAAYMSLLGTISITVSNDSEIKKLRWFLNIGFNL
jgi:NTE family protein